MTEKIFEIDDPIWEEVVELAAVAAGQALRHFRGFLEFDDLKQVASEYAFRRQDKVREYLFEEFTDGEWVRRYADRARMRQGETALITIMRRQCVIAARKEKAKRLGYMVEDEFFYQPDLVENLIKVWASGDYELAGQVFDQTDMGGKRTSKPANEGNNLLAMIADVGNAMRRLELRDYSVLMFRYCEGQTLQQIADFMDISPQRVEQISQRATRKVIQILGGT
jgi:RNA polymerase sigma factor (sigma-70 family)